MDVVELGALLRRARERSGLSQGDLARMAGLSRATVNYAERGRVGIGADALIELMALLDISLNPTLDDNRAIRLLAQTASVSYREKLSSAVLLRAFGEGSVPKKWVPHIATLLDEAPDRLLLRGVREVARKTRQPVESIWRNVQLLAETTDSTNPRWRHVA